MKRKFFLKNLLSFFIPTLIPLLILSFLATAFMFSFVGGEMEQNNQNMLVNAKNSLETTFDSANRIAIGLNSNTELTINLKQILKSGKLSYDYYYNYKNLRNYILSLHSANPAISSIYLYYDNPNRNFITSTGVYSLEGFYDTEWYDYYQRHWENGEVIYQVRRAPIGYRQDTFEEYLTVYRNIVSPGSSENEGIIAVNLYVSYIQNALNSLRVGRDEGIVIASDDGQIIGQNDNFKRMSREYGLSQAENRLESEEFGREFIVSSLGSDTFRWNYYSVVPRSTVYKLPYRLSLITLFLLLGTLAIGFLLALRNTRKLQGSVNSIIDMLEKAETEHAALPPSAEMKNDYDYIIQNILNLFIRQNFLKVQLSEKKYRLEVMELLALQSQINPHFLYNTLQTIYLKALAFTKGPNDVSRMVEYLIMILRYSLGSPTSVVPLAEEIANVRAYIKLEQYQYGSRFSVLWDADGDLDRVEIPKLILQPLVENCIHHGMRENSRKLGVKVRIYRQKGFVIFRIIDNGMGMSVEKLREIRKKLLELADQDSEEPISEHIGLFNTAKRLRLAYPGEGSICVRSKYHTGTSVTVRIPERPKSPPG